jgi:hypothetical protein
LFAWGSRRVKSGHPGTRIEDFRLGHIFADEKPGFTNG